MAKESSIITSIILYINCTLIPAVTAQEAKIKFKASISPNPTISNEALLEIDFKQSNKNTILLITDLSGKRVVNKSLGKVNGVYLEKISTEGLQKGIYIINVLQEKQPISELLRTVFLAKH